MEVIIEVRYAIGMEATLPSSVGQPAVLVIGGDTEAAPEIMRVLQRHGASEDVGEVVDLGTLRRTTAPSGTGRSLRSAALG